MKRLGHAPATYAIAITIAVLSFALPYFQPPAELAVMIGFVPARVAGGVAADAATLPVWLTPLSASFYEHDWFALLVNIAVFVFMGQQVERAIGSRGVAVMYVASAYAGAAGQWLLGPQSVWPALGTSSAVGGMVAAYALLFGGRNLGLKGAFVPRLVQALWFAAFWIAISLAIELSGGTGHLTAGWRIGGFIAGLALTWPLFLWRYRKA